MTQYDSRAKKRNLQIGYMNFAQILSGGFILVQIGTGTTHDLSKCPQSHFGIQNLEFGPLRLSVPWEFLSLRINLAPPGPPTLTLDRARAACEIAAQAHPSLPPPPQLRLRTELQIENEIEIELEIEKVRSTRSWCILCKAVPRTMKYEEQQRYMS